jgi:hypothetical protein
MTETKTLKELVRDLEATQINLRSLEGLEKMDAKTFEGPISITLTIDGTTMDLTNIEPLPLIRALKPVLADQIEMTKKQIHDNIYPPSTSSRAR